MLSPEEREGMIEEAIIKKVHSLYDLRKFCKKHDIEPYCYMINREDLDEAVNDALVCYIGCASWFDIYDMLKEVDVNCDYFIVDYDHDFFIPYYEENFEDALNELLYTMKFYNMFDSEEFDCYVKDQCCEEHDEEEIYDLYEVA